MLKQRIYLIYNPSIETWKERVDSLVDAANRLQLKPELINADEFDFSKWKDIRNSKIDLFYNVTPFSHEIENIFIHKGLTSFFINPNKINYIFSTHQLNLSLINAGVPMPKTIFKGTNNRELLSKYVEYLGGFPIIIKANGGSTGVGVIKSESWENLISICDLLHYKRIDFHLKEFVQNKGTIRIVAVGNKIVGSVLRLNLEKDFRCSNPNYTTKEVEYPCNPEIFEITNKINKAVNYDFFGADVIMDELGRYYVLEVNFPNNFVPPANFENSDIAYEALKYLKDKSKKLLTKPKLQ